MLRIAFRFFVQVDANALIPHQIPQRCKLDISENRGRKEKDEMETTNCAGNSEERTLKEHID